MNNRLLALLLLDDGCRAGREVDATHSFSSVEAVVAVLSPGSSPGVLDDPVRLDPLEVSGGVDSEADYQDPVVDTARFTEQRRRVTHSAHVELHGEGVQTDSDGTVLQEPLRHLCLVGRHLHSTVHTDG